MKITQVIIRIIIKQSVIYALIIDLANNALVFFRVQHVTTPKN